MAKHRSTSWRARLLLLFLALPAVPGLLPEFARAAEPEYPCQITIRTKLKSGAEKKRIFPAKSARDAAACARQAKTFETNFYPPGIVSKEVEHRWNERAEGVRE